MIDHYEPDIITAQDYYPFGMLSRVVLPNNDKSYRFGFNGKENDNEVKGLGNQQDYGFRVYDPRIGKFLSVDPLTKDYPWYTPYQFAGNKPIWSTDLDGLEENPTTNSNGTTPARESTSTNNYPSTAIVRALTARLHGGSNRSIRPGTVPLATKIKATLEILDAKYPNNETVFIAKTLYGVIDDVHITYTNVKNGRGHAKDLEGYSPDYKETIGAGLNTTSLLFSGLESAAGKTLLTKLPLTTFETSSLKITQTLETNAEMKVLRRLRSSIEENGINYNLKFNDQIQVFNYNHYCPVKLVSKWATIHSRQGLQVKNRLFKKCGEFPTI